jgi:hypothetical protein
MPRRRAPLVAMAVVCALAAVGGAQVQGPRPAGQASAPVVADGLIAGRVVDGNSGQPIPDALVALNGGGLARGVGGLYSGGDLEVRTDAQGRFVFAGLPAGSFYLSATADGYARGTYGQAHVERGPRPLTLLPSQKTGDVSIVMSRYAVISGMVIDDAGDPVIGATVKAMARAKVGSLVRFTGNYVARTDDRGAYRISRLPAGDFVVSVPSSTTTMPASVVEYSQALQSSGDQGGVVNLNNQLLSSGAPTPSTRGLRMGDLYLQPGSNDADTFVQTGGGVMVRPTAYFPGVSLVSEARIVAVASGDDRTNVDFQTSMARGVRVSGTLAGPDGPAARFGVTLLPTDHALLAAQNGIQIASAVTTAEGLFTFAAVPAGSYVLRALRLPTQVGRPGAGVPSTYIAQTTVTVGERDLADIALALREGPRVSGRTVFNGTNAPPALGGAASDRGPRVTVSMQPADGSGRYLPPVTVNADGRFTTPSLPPGRYFLTAGAPGWTLQSAIINGRDATRVPITLESDDAIDAIVTFVDRTALLTGVVRNAAGAPDASTTIYIYPADFDKGVHAGEIPRPMHVALPDPSGTFRMGGILPGEYLVVAVNDAGLDIADELGLATRLAPHATRVVIGPGARPTVEVTTAVVRR